MFHIPPLCGVSISAVAAFWQKLCLARCYQFQIAPPDQALVENDKKSLADGTRKSSKNRATQSRLELERGTGTWQSLDAISLK
ncbi:hypothetical protein NKI19_31550 [Mesorhizobium sp. M0751]|uniref:hypothetical protein n=1 Tax=unclassified Mesorhizobium TaxID=325217 RepID=UPI00333D203F